MLCLYRNAASTANRSDRRRKTAAASLWGAAVFFAAHRRAWGRCRQQHTPAARPAQGTRRTLTFAAQPPQSPQKNTERKKRLLSLLLSLCMVLCLLPTAYADSENYWTNFRNSPYNMAITDAPTPTSAETTVEKWVKKIRLRLVRQPQRLCHC